MSEQVTIEYPTAIYTLITTSRGGLPAIVVVNEALVAFEHRDIFPWHLTVTLEAREVADKGMPTQDEDTALEEVGVGIEDVVLADRLALFLGRVTNGGERELHYRVNDPDHIDAGLQRLLASPALRSWSYEMVGDEEWSLAEPLLNLVRDARSDRR